MDTCLGFQISCETLILGTATAVMGGIIFIACIYVLLAAVMGRTMGFYTLVVSLSGWMIILSSLWLFGFWSQGLETPTNLGPRGGEPAWTPVTGSIDATSEEFPQIAEYPGGTWRVPGDAEDDVADIQSTTGAIQTFLTEQANEELGVEEGGIGSITPPEFTVQNLRFATSDGTKLAAAQGFYNGGGPAVTVLLYYDTGSVPRYSYMFLGGSILVFLIFLPLLDRAEKKRKDVLTGGTAPAWYGPA